MIGNESIIEMKENNHFNRTASRFSQIQTFNREPSAEVRQQRCKSPFICLLFFIAIIAMIGLTVFGFVQGNPKRILSPIRTQLTLSPTFDACFYNKKEQFGYLYNTYFNPIFNYNLTSSKYCLNECPSFPINNQIIAYQQNSLKNPIWNNYVSLESNAGLSYNTQPVYYQSIKIANRICVPHSAYHNWQIYGFTINNSKLFAQKVILPFTAQPISSFLLDVSNNWYMLIFVAAFISLINLIYSFFMRRFIKFTIYLSFILLSSSFLGIALLFLYNSGNLKTPATHTYLGVPDLTYTYEKRYFGVIFFVLMGISIFLEIIFAIRFLNKSLNIIEIVGSFISLANPKLSIYRISYFIIIFIFIFGLVVLTYIASVNEKIRSSDQNFQANQKLFYANIYALLMFWLYLVIIQQTQSYYLITYYETLVPSYNPRKIQKRFVCIFGDVLISSFLKYFYHLSFVTKHFIIDMIDHKCCSQSKNIIVQLSNPSPILQQYINGKSFTKSTEASAELHWNHNQQLTIINTAKIVFLFIRIAISSLITILAYLFLTFQPRVRNNFVHIPMALIVVFVYSYILIGSWLICYTTAIDAMYQYLIRYPNKARSQLAYNSQLKDIMSTFKRLITGQKQNEIKAPSQLIVQDINEMNYV